MENVLALVITEGKGQNTNQNRCDITPYEQDKNYIYAQIGVRYLIYLTKIMHIDQDLCIIPSVVPGKVVTNMLKDNTHTHTHTIAIDIL